MLSIVSSSLYVLLFKCSSMLKAFSDIDKFCSIVLVDNIIKNDYNLHVSLHGDTSDSEPEIDVRIVNKGIKE